MKKHTLENRNRYYRLFRAELWLQTFLHLQCLPSAFIKLLESCVDKEMKYRILKQYDI